jgi:hypothetical protein
MEYPRFASYREKDGFRFAPRRLRFISQLIVAHLMLIERDRKVSKRRKDQWNSWVAWIWKNDVADKMKNT